MKILVVKLSSLGDVLHALPAAVELARRTGAEIHWAVQPEFAALVRAFACVTRVIEVPRPSKLTGWLRGIRDVRKERYDLVVDFQGLLKSAIVAGCARGHKVIGPAYPREGARWFYDARPPKGGGRKHAVEECMDVVESCVQGFKGSGGRNANGIGLRLPELPDRIPARGEGARIAIAPKSRWDSKNWPAENFLEVAKKSAERGAEVFIVGGKGDGDEFGIQNPESKIRNTCGKLSLLESAALIESCDCLVTNDSGPMHIAAALGVKCVAVFGPTDATRTGPYGEGHTVLRAPEGVCDAAPCYKRVCPKGTKACMTAVTAEAVFFQTVK